VSPRNVVALETAVDRAVERMRKAGGAPGTGPRPAEGFVWTPEALHVFETEVQPARQALRASEVGHG
jgi:hypothetical protein